MDSLNIFLALRSAAKTVNYHPMEVPSATSTTPACQLSVKPTIECVGSFTGIVAVRISIFKGAGNPQKFRGSTSKPSFRELALPLPAHKIPGLDYDYFERSRCQNIVPQVSCLYILRYRVLNSPLGQRVHIANMKNGPPNVSGQTHNQHPLDYFERKGFQHHPILERSRVILLTIADNSVRAVFIGF